MILITLYYSSDGLKLDNTRHTHPSYVTGHYDKDNISENFVTVLLPVVAMDTSTNFKCVTSYLGNKGLATTLTRKLNMSASGK